MGSNHKTLISVVIPCYNEESNIDEIYSRLSSVMKTIGEDYELIFIDDGSTDSSLEKLLALIERDQRVSAIEFSRNFGHQAAICAGLDYSRGAAVIMMDADLQHPPEIIPILIEKWREGCDIVYTIRKDPPATSLFKKITAKAFYKIINLLANIEIPKNSADFCLLDKTVVDRLNTLSEKTKFFRGIISWVGFKRSPVYYDAAPRFAGHSKYSVWKMMKFAFDGITSFSAFPLHIATIFGTLVSALSFVYAMYAIYIRLFTNDAVPGWTSVLVAVLFLGGVQLLCLGVLGEYLNRVYTETKSRPTYIVRKAYGLKE